MDVGVMGKALSINGVYGAEVDGTGVAATWHAPLVAWVGDGLKSK